MVLTHWPLVQRLGITLHSSISAEQEDKEKRVEANVCAVETAGTGEEFRDWRGVECHPREVLESLFKSQRMATWEGNRGT